MGWGCEDREADFALTPVRMGRVQRGWKLGVFALVIPLFVCVCLVDSQFIDTLVDVFQCAKGGDDVFSFLLSIACAIPLKFKIPQHVGLSYRIALSK